MKTKEDLSARIRPRPFRSRLRVRDSVINAPAKAPPAGR